MKAWGKGIQALHVGKAIYTIITTWALCACILLKSVLK